MEKIKTKIIQRILFSEYNRPVTQDLLIENEIHVWYDRNQLHTKGISTKTYIFLVISSMPYYGFKNIFAHRLGGYDIIIILVLNSHL